MWGLGKLAEELTGTVDGRQVLPTAASTAPEEEGRRRKQLGLGKLTSAELTMQMDQAQATSVAKQKGEADKVSLCGS
jgi:hypothetical protein